MWKTSEINLGDIKQKVLVKVQFYYLGKGTLLSKTSSCGCSTPTWDANTNILEVSYTPNELPIHLKQEGKQSYSSTKYVNVSMQEETGIKEYSLTIKAEVYE